MASIPKIIHQTWKTTEIPAEWQAFSISWQDAHPEWEYRLWTDEETHDFVATVYPDFLPIYEAYQYNIERVDAVRYLILEHFGGVYVDLDIECLQPVDELLVNHSCLLASQPPKHAERHNEAMLVCNSFMASVPKHPYWQMVMQWLVQTDSRLCPDLTVVHRTGPNMLQRAWEDYQAEKPDTRNDRENDVAVHVLESHVTSPLIIAALAHDYYQKTGELPTWYKSRLVSNGTYAIHYFANSWLPPVHGELINPHPEQIPGFVFYQGVKSSDYTLENLGRNIPEIAKACLKDKRVVAFDTDGYTKSYILPTFQWIKRISPESNEGLYLRKGLGVKLWLWINHVYVFSQRWVGRLQRFLLSHRQGERSNKEGKISS